MELTKQQKEFLFLIGRNKSKGISELGREVYSTNKSCYDVVYDFQEKGLIDLKSYKNKLIPLITIKGKRFIEKISKNM